MTRFLDAASWIEETRAAHEYFESDDVFGKVVLIP